jgi:predicted nucleotidyltransferase
MTRTENLSLLAAQKSEAATRLKHGIWSAAQNGMSQREIARAVGMSQPAVSQFIAAIGQSDPLAQGPLGRSVLAQRELILEIADKNNATDVHIFGSTARGEDTPTSDVDIFVTVPENYDMMSLALLEEELFSATGLKCDVIARHHISAEVRETVLSAGIPL